MYIRSRVRGTNQHAVKGALIECIICSSCGAFNDEFKPYKEENGFVNPRREKNTECHKCKKSLLPVTGRPTERG